MKARYSLAEKGGLGEHLPGLSGRCNAEGAGRCISGTDFSIELPSPNTLQTKTPVPSSRYRGYLLEGFDVISYKTPAEVQREFTMYSGCNP